jgi:hypothetical protein
MRARIDVSEIETQTKIRAKYLRALENEEWDLLPGPTYVKSFLRTYAEALDLDAKLLVDEYKLRHERLSDVELQPINAAAPGRERRKSGPIIPPGVFIVLIFVALIVALYLLGSGGGGKPSTADNPAAATQPATTTPAAPAAPVNTPPPRRQTVRLQIIGTGDVNVCLKAGNRTLVNGATLGAGDRTGSFNSKRFRLTLGNNNAILRINGKNKRVKPSSQPIGLRITPNTGRQPLSAARRPVCR